MASGSDLVAALLAKGATQEQADACVKLFANYQEVMEGLRGRCSARLAH